MKQRLTTGTSGVSDSPVQLNRSSKLIYCICHLKLAESQILEEKFYVRDIPICLGLNDYLTLHQ